MNYLNFSADFPADFPSDIEKNISHLPSFENAVPELPNFITLIYHKFQGALWAEFLHEWQNVIFAILVAIFISFVFTWGIRKKALIPSGMQNFLELIAESLQSLVLGVLGTEGEKYIPFLGTLFIYILSMNLAGLVPLMKAPSSNLNVTVALAICVFTLVQYLNMKHMGPKKFFYHLAGSPKTPLQWAIAPFMFCLELLTQLSRPVTLALRLFGNVLGEDILIGAFALFGLSMLAHLNSPVGIPLQVPFMFLAILTGLMQALVFTLLSAVYILLTIPDSEENH